MKHKMITILCVTAVVVTLVSVLFCHKEYGFASYQSTNKLEINQPFKFKPFGPIQWKLLEIDKAHEKCLFELRDLAHGKVALRWVCPGDSICFDPNKVPERGHIYGVFLREIGQNTVIIDLRWGEEAYTYRWGFR